jgi:hypothetical protein
VPVEPIRRDAVWLVGAIALSYPLGLALDPKILLPVLNAAPAWWVMTRRLRAGDLRGAILLMLVFPLALAFFGTLSLALWPTADGRIPPVMKGAEYRDEMFHWIRTGVGSEGDWRLFLPIHITHLVAFLLISVLTASLVSITGGAILTNYMDGYVASLHLAGAPLWATIFFGWQPWAICRVAGFCIFGVILADPLLSRVFRYEPQPWSKVRPWAMRAALLIAADWVLKALLAPGWGRILADAISQP